jgi:uroporphyrin-3 C-methyltransferase
MVKERAWNGSAMTDVQENDQPKSDTMKASMRLARSRRWVMALLVLLGLGLAGQQIWTLRLWEGLDKEVVEVDSVESRLATLEAALANQHQVRQEVDAMRLSLEKERRLLQLDRMEERIDTGWQIWVATGDNKTLVNALRDGQNALSGDASATAQTLRLAMGHDLTEIKAQHMTDLRETVEELDGVIASIDKLPLVQDRRLPASEPIAALEAPTAQSADTLIDKAHLIVTGLAEELWQSIRSMVRVQKLDHAEAGLIAPEQRVFLQQGLRLLLLDARHSLIQRNTATYQQTLSQARSWIEKYCDGSAPLVKSDLSILQRLAGQNIEISAVSLEATRAALENARNALSGMHEMSPDSDTSSVPPSTDAKAKGASE